ncbi:MAG: hypothetical protein DRN37_00160 [Thermoplasmata archaeon]|nr:MAG: hypothetical protein DRN37_00160 [Thermoplasmata archaeon]
MIRHKRCKSRECPLFKQTEVPYSGDKRASIILAGESPGFHEVKEGKPFVGRAGRLIKKACRKAGVRWEDFLITNAARCRIDKDKLSPKDVTKILQYCRAPIEKAIRTVRPKAIVVAGNIAMRQILKRSGIKKARGRWEWSKEFGCWVLPIYHPAYILRNMALEETFVRDLKMVDVFVKNGYAPPDETEDQYEYVEVKSRSDLPKLVRGQACGFDTEDFLLDWMAPDHNFISFSVSPAPGKAYNFTLFVETHCDDPERVKTVTVPRIPEGKKKVAATTVAIKKAPLFNVKMKWLKLFLESKDIKKYMMNGNFDIHAVQRLFRDYGGGEIRIENYCMDVQAAANLIEENVYSLSSLEFLQQSFTDFRFDYNSEFTKKYGKEDMLGVPEEDFTFYSCADADMTLRVGMKLKEELLREPRLARYLTRFTMPTLQTLWSMEDAGALIDDKKLPETKEEVHHMMLQAQKLAWKAIPKAVKERHKKGKGIKLTRQELVRDTLFAKDGYGLKPVGVTASGDPSVGKESRVELRDRRIPNGARVFLQKYDEWSECNTLYTRYLKGFEKAIKPDGRIHTHYSVAKTVTGRISSAGPNLMNVPKRSKAAKKIRRLIVAPKGYKLLAIDQSQSELRWFAHVAQEREMLRIFRSNELDIHTETAKTLVHEDWHSLSDDEHSVARRNAKAVNFGLLFGMQVNGFIQYAKTEYGIDLSQDQAVRWIELFFGKYSGIRPFHKRTVAFCKKHGYVESPLGRKRRLPEIISRNMGLRMRAERQAINFPVQGPSSDCVLIAMNEMRRKVREGKLNFNGCRVILFIHDELVFEVRDDERLVDYARIIKQEMENPPLERDFGVRLSVPLVAEAKVGENLAEMVDLDLEE